ncbi:plasminogen activator inhibitor 1-like isoform X1 [Uranotaenia lowii]|uniref:plasminogen activator inhibitor 1-like isoform X1 n=1 Tax=Uranotaenia lowii TaxID=190385 RepID=UPI002478B730|nr:plasminogen activator inhibitor 1-like isoform X1 [Uranotaenia lowii]
MRSLVFLFLFAQVIGLLANDAARTKFSFDFLRLTNRHNPGENLIVAPVGIHTSLAAMYHQAQPNVAQELQTVLGLAPNKQQVEREVNDLLASSRSETLSMVFKLYHARYNGLKRPLLTQSLQDKYQIPVEAVDFEQGQQVADSANAWVERVTKSMIKNLYAADDFSEQDSMMLLNVLTMNATWDIPFITKDTKKDVFHFANGDHSVDMMETRGNFNYCEISKFEAVELAYEAHTDLAMLIIMPNSAEPFESALKHLDASVYEEINRKLTSHWTLDVHLPKFSITKKTKANNILQQMGLSAVFQDDAFEANHRLSSIEQNGRIDVTEQGTTAAVVTETRMVFRSGAIDVPINRPFVYLVRKQSTKEIMFIGYYAYYQ